MRAWPKFKILGQTILGDFMVSNDTEYTTEDITSVQTEWTKQSLRSIENFVKFNF